MHGLESNPIDIGTVIEYYVFFFYVELCDVLNHTIVHGVRELMYWARIYANTVTVLYSCTLHEANWLIT